MFKKMPKIAAVAGALTAALAFFTPTAQAGEPGTDHYSCGQPRPPQRDGSRPVQANNTTGVYRGSSFGCGANGTMVPGDWLDYYCTTIGNDGRGWTYVSVYERGFAGWAFEDYLPYGGSSVPCPIF